jgi:hypothetical protein
MHLATTKTNDRRALYLYGLGYRYRELMEITGAVGEARARQSVPLRLAERPHNYNL